jgi:hypothetical protein
VEILLKLLNDFDCFDLPKFRGALSRFPDDGSTSIIRPNEDIRVVKIRFTRESWYVTRKEFAEKISHEKLEEVGTYRLC